MSFASTVARILGITPPDTLASEGATVQSTLPTHADWLAWANFYPINLATALALPGVFRANVLVTDLAAQVDWYQERRVVDDTGVRWERVTDPVPIIRQPNPSEPVDETISTLVAGMAGHGESALLLGAHDTRGRAQSATWIPHDELDVQWAPNKITKVWSWRGRELTRGQDLLYLPHYMPPGQLRGVGPIQVYARQLLGWSSAEEWARSFFEYGSTSPVTIEVPGDGDKTEADEIREAYMDTHAGLQSPGVVFGGAHVVDHQITPDKAQMLDTRRWHVQMAANMYGLNPYMLAVAMSGANITYQTLPDLFAEAVRLTIYPTYLRKIETAFTQLLPRGNRVRFDLSEFLRADEKTRMETAQIGIATGVHTIDEWRIRENLPRRKTADAAANN